MGPGPLSLRGTILPMSEQMPPAMILCGGQGTRLRDVTESLPKPMVPIGPQPIVWHLMKSHAAFGVKRFILCLGYKREAFVEWLLNYRAFATDVTLKLGSGEIVHHGGHDEDDWEVTLADTGLHSMTGARVARAAKYVDGDEFFLTYGDGLADVDVGALLKHHRAQGKRLTVTAIQPSHRFGELELDGDTIKRFREKPAGAEWVNGGFMVATKDFVDKHCSTDASCVLEREPMESAVAAGQVAARRHEGFWQCLDTAREYAYLNRLWDEGDAPWTKHW